MSATEKVAPKGEGIRKLGKSLWNVFTKEVQVPITSAPSPTNPKSDAPVKSVETGVSGVVDDGFMEKIWKVIEAANISGMDFFEFNRLLNKSKSIRAVDKYTSAYESIKALDDKNPNMKATLLESGQIYLDILTKEKNEFDAGFDDLVESEIGTQQKKFNDLSTEVGALQQQKAELEKKINEHNVSLGALEDEISTKNVDLQRQRKNFLSTMDTVTADISGKLENIKLHIPDEITNDKTA